MRRSRTGISSPPASGAAFIAVVIAQAANAFACRGSARWPGAPGWRTNRLLIPAVTIGLPISLAMLFIDPIAHELGHISPPIVGWTVAAGAVLAVDALDKRRRRSRQPLAAGGVFTSRLAHARRRPRPSSG